MSVPPLSSDPPPAGPDPEPADRFTRSQDTTRPGPVGWPGPLSPFVKLSMYGTAGEAVACVVVPRRPLDEAEGQLPPEPSDPADLWRRANARARARSRRYMVHNRLRYMWVLTMAGEGLHGPEGRRVMMARMATFIRRLRAEVGPLPYWYSPELHPGGHGWHCNLFLPDRVRHADVERLWAGGYVWVSDWAEHKRDQGRTFIEAIRAGASYGSKYASKDWDAVQLAGRAHRYERAEGYDPPVVEVECWTLDQAQRLAVGHLGIPSAIWRSDDEDDWDGPRCWTMRFRSPGGGGG